MSEDHEQTTERRGSSKQIIEHLLAERQQLLGLLLQVSDMKVENDNINTDVLDEFCQVTVDYIASGHFGLYERIVEGTERRRGVADLAVSLYPKIEQSTELALAFNEKYDASDKELDYSTIHEDLSLLGEHLTTRIEYEDELIQKMSEPK